MRHAIYIGIGLALVGCNSNNEPQYVECAPMGPAAMDTCVLNMLTMNADGELEAKGSIHVPVKPEADWKQADRLRRMELQMALPDQSVEVPVYRLEHYDLEVEWTAKNLDSMPGQFKVDLNGANEVFTYDPSLIVTDPGDDEAPPTPPLAGNIPIDIPANGTVSGTFREDQLVEAAIDLDQISRGNVNPFAAWLDVAKNKDSFQPLTAPVYDPVTGDTTYGMPTGPEVPRLAFRQLVRIDIVFHPDRMMTLEYTLRVREHVEVIHPMGLNAPAGEIEIYDPAPFVPALGP
jgi:hypothetical protein